MGGEQSTPVGTAEDVEIDGSKFGYRVLDITPGSPTEVCELVCYLDFIVHANGVRLADADDTFVELIKKSENQPMVLTVYNTKSKSIREVTFTPRIWNGPGLLGLTIKFDTYEDFDNMVLHVLEIQENSPAEQAGLIPFDDFLLGTPELVFQDLDDLYEILTSSVESQVEVYVYSVASDSVRRTIIAPKAGWGGEGILGADIGHGFLHRFPNEANKTNGRTDNGEHANVIIKPEFLLQCNRVVEVQTPLGPGKQLVPFAGTEDLAAPQGSVYVKLDWEFKEGTGITCMALMLKSSIEESVPEPPPKPTSLVPVEDESPPEPPPKPPTLTSQQSDDENPPEPPPKPVTLSVVEPSET